MTEKQRLHQKKDQDRDAVEVNFDGLVGPTHNYAGLSSGNIASTGNEGQVSNPRAAALQGLTKMRSLMEMGFTQGVIPPHPRPSVDFLRRIGFSGSDAEVIQKAVKNEPSLFRSACSASAMWTANAATVSPSPDTSDGRVHFTPANLTAKIHRSIEPVQTGLLLQKMFPDRKHFRHHPSLPPGEDLGDEGAANHTRFTGGYGQKGVEFFVYGRKRGGSPAPKIFPARQTLEASRSVSRLHGLDEKFAVFAQQNPHVIDQGVFHNDVIAVGNRNFHFFHEDAFLDSPRVEAELKACFEKATGLPLVAVKVPRNRISVSDAVATYLFNTQLLSLGDDRMVLVAPTECENHREVSRFLAEMVGDSGNPLVEVKYFDLRQSMWNGGGPACLRLRVVLTPKELKAVHPEVLMDDQRLALLEGWVSKHYRDRLGPEDLGDPQLWGEVRTALDELTQILNLGSIYPFQTVPPGVGNGSGV